MFKLFWPDVTKLNQTLYTVHIYLWARLGYKVEEESWCHITQQSFKFREILNYLCSDISR